MTISSRLRVLATSSALALLPCSFLAASGVIQFDSSSLETNGIEGGSIDLIVARTGSTVGPTSVNYSLSSITATAGSDYVAGGGTVNFADGENKGTVSVSFLSDSAPEHIETLEVTLSSPTNGATLGSDKTALIRIRDDDWADTWVKHYLDFGTEEIPVHPTPALGEPSGPGPLPLVISGVPGKILDLRVKISDLSHQRTNDLDVILEGPNGQFCKLMSDFGTGKAGENTNIRNANLCFRDGGAPVDPNSSLSSGEWQPFDHAPGADLLLDLTPIPDAGTSSLSIFNGILPNGTWHLHIMDDYQGSGGSPPYFTGALVGGWELIMEIEPVLPTITSIRNLNSVTTGLFFNGPPGVEYVFERSETLQPNSWVPVQNITTTGGPQQLNSNRNVYPTAYLRFRIP